MKGTQEGSGMAQFKDWWVCQFCGRAAPRGSDGWLDQPRRGAWDGTRIRRCPEHWSEWALRQTRAGRTKENRAAMARALAMPVPPIPAHLSPFPMTDKEETNDDRSQHRPQTEL